MNLEVLKHLVDVHAHPTDAPSISEQAMESLQISVCAMSTRQSDQPLVYELAKKYPTKIIPCFGHHPWFSHVISSEVIAPDKEIHYRKLFLPGEQQTPGRIEAFQRLLPLLPQPILLRDVIADLRRHLEAFPDAMLGEVGLDRVFRVSFDYFAGPRELTPFVIPLDHQLVILEAQIDLAVVLGRNVSLHSVKASSPTVDFLAKMREKHGLKWDAISVDLHSCGLSPETWKTISKLHPNAFLSLSTAINGRSPNHRALISACPDDRILAESDYPDIEKCASRTWDMVSIIAEIKGWDIEMEWVDGTDEARWGVVRKLQQNWKLFKEGNHHKAPQRYRNNKRILLDSDVE